MFRNRMHVERLGLFSAQPYSADIRPTEIGITNFKSYYAQRLHAKRVSDAPKALLRLQSDNINKN